MRQIISFDPDRAVTGQPLDLTVSHQVSDSQEQPQRLSFRLFFNSQQLDLQDTEVLSGISSNALGQVLSDVEENLDNDLNTDQVIRFTVAELNAPFTFPLDETNLFTLNFNVVDGNFDTTPIGIQEVFTEDGFEFVPPENQSITITPTIELPTISIADRSKEEGNEGNTAFEFIVTRTGDTSEAITVNYETRDGTAIAGEDYTAVTDQTVTIAAGQNQATISVQVTGDTIEEVDQTFTVNLTGSSQNATIEDGEALATIINDDVTPPPTISIADRSQLEGDEGNTAFQFTVTLSEASQQDVTVNFSTADGTATAGEDYTAVTNETVTIAANQTSATFTVNVTGDNVEELDETFTVNLGNASGATIPDSEATATATIQNDDATISINDLTLAEGSEGNTFNFTVTRTGDTSEAITVNYQTANGTAIAGEDYTAVTDGTVTIAAEQTEATISVQVLNDDDFEAQENFFVNLTNADNATISDGQGRGIITNEAVDTLLPGTINGSLSNSDDDSDDTYIYDDESYSYDFYALPVDSDIDPGDIINITLTSQTFAPLLMILNSDGTQVLEFNASTDRTTSTINSFVVPEEPFFLSVETLESNSIGDYNLTVEVI